MSDTPDDPKPPGPEPGGPASPPAGGSPAGAQQADAPSGPAAPAPPGPAPDPFSAPQPRARIEALFALLARPDVGTILPPIYRLKGDPDADVRYVAGKLERLVLANPLVQPSTGDKAARQKVREKFSQLLSNPRSRARLGALTKALKYKTKELLPLVEERLGQEESAAVLAAMVSLLGQLGDLRYTPAILPLLGHSDARVVAYSITALSNLGHDAVLPLIKPFLTHKDSRVIGSALSAIIAHDPDCVFQTLERLVASDAESDLECALHCICQLEDPRGVPIATKILAKATSPELSEATRDYLTRAAKAAPEAFLETLRQGLGNPDPAVRLRTIAEATEHLDHPEVRGLIEMLAQMDPNAEVAQAARNAVAADLADLGESKSGQSQSASGLLAEATPSAPEAAAASLARLVSKFRGLLTRRQERLRMKAVLKVKKYRKRDLLPLVLERMEWETSPIVLAAMLATLADIGSENDVPLISPYLSHRNYRVVNAAILALHRLGGDSVLPLFLLLLSRDDPRIQSQAFVALLRLNTKELLLHIQSMAVSPRQEVRSTALTYLERLREPEIEDILILMIDRETSRSLLTKEVELLRTVATARSAAPLYLMKKEHPEREVLIHQIIKEVSERSGISVYDLEVQADELLKSRPELPLFQELRAREPEATDKPAAQPLAHLIYDRPTSDAWRMGILAGVVVLILFGGYVQSLNDPTSTDLEDPHKRAQRIAEELARPTPKIYAELPRRITPIVVEELREAAEARFHRVPVLTPDQRYRQHRDFLKSVGYDNDEYIEMKAKGEVRDLYNKALEDARKRVDEKDFDGAITIVKDAIGATQKDNLLVLRDLYKELSGYLLKAGRPEESRKAALTCNDLSVKILQICSATRRPGTNETLATSQDVATLKAYTRQIDASYDRVASLGIGPSKDLKAARTELAKAKLAELKSKGLFTEDEYRDQLRDVEAGRRPRLPARLKKKGSQ